VNPLWGQRPLSQHAAALVEVVASAAALRADAEHWLVDGQAAAYRPAGALEGVPFRAPHGCDGGQQQQR